MDERGIESVCLLQFLFYVWCNIAFHNFLKYHVIYLVFSVHKLNLFIYIVDKYIFYMKQNLYEVIQINMFHMD